MGSSEKKVVRSSPSLGSAGRARGRARDLASRVCRVPAGSRPVRPGEDGWDSAPPRTRQPEASLTSELRERYSLQPTRGGVKLAPSFGQRD